MKRKMNGKRPLQDFELVIYKIAKDRVERKIGKLGLKRSGHKAWIRWEMKQIIASIKRRSTS